MLKRIIPIQFKLEIWEKMYYMYFEFVMDLNFGSFPSRKKLLYSL